MAPRFAHFAILIFGSILTSNVPAAAQDSGADARLQSAIDRAIHADGPFFLASERAMIERKCGYAADEWDGENVSFNDGVLICSNGRRVADPEVRAMMRLAGERISRRVNDAMNSPEIRSAIAAVSDEAVRRALDSPRDDRASNRRER